jgi:hypothetical protein
MKKTIFWFLLACTTLTQEVWGMEVEITDNYGNKCQRGHVVKYTDIPYAPDDQSLEIPLKVPTWSKSAERVKRGFPSLNVRMLELLSSGNLKMEGIAFFYQIGKKARHLQFTQEGIFNLSSSNRSKPHEGESYTEALFALRNLEKSSMNISEFLESLGEDFPWDSTYLVKSGPTKDSMGKTMIFYRLLVNDRLLVLCARRSVGQSFPSISNASLSVSTRLADIKFIERRKE